MDSLIPKPNVDMSERSHLLPPFLRLNSKITFEHEGQYHKGFLTQASNGDYCFSYKSHINKKHPNWSISLPNLTPIGAIYVFRGFSSQATTPPHLSTRLQPILSAPLTLFGNAHVLSSTLLTTNIPIAMSNYKAFERRKMGCYQWTPTTQSHWSNIVPTIKRVHPARFPLCAS
jgi:hypothetical protein